MVTEAFACMDINMVVVPCFAVVGPIAWNSLCNDLRDPDLNIIRFGRLLMTNLFQQ